VDTVARLIAPPLAATLGQNIVVENKPGAGGVIGTDFVAKSSPDGYTFLMTHAGVMVYSAATLPSLPFDPIADFTHLGMLVEAPSVLLVRGDSPFRTLANYIAAARTRPVRYGSSGVGSALHILGAMLTGAADLRELDHTPYQGSGPAIRDLLSGPRGLPRPIAERLMAAIPVVLQAPAVQERMAQLVTLSRDPPPLGGDFVEIIRADMRTARDVARRYNITSAS
jgi:tripartite-type tricarboxylate transporter receptor subunit TctC